MLSRVEIRDRIRQLIKERGLSPQDVEKLAGVSDTAIYEWIRGERLPNRRKGEAVIAALTSGGSPEEDKKKPVASPRESHQGWICPKCDSAVAPHVEICPNCKTKGVKS